MTFRPRTVFVAAALAASLAACGSEPKVDIQTAKSPAASESPAVAANAPAVQGEPAAAHASAAGEMPAGQELPTGHPPVGNLPPGHPAVAPGQAAPGMGMPFRPVVAPGGQGSAALAWSTPKGWTSEPPANEMRRAQYRVPGASGDAECVVFYFGPGQGGDPMSNAERWAGQFAQPGGGSPAAALKTRSEKVGAIQVLFVETHGTYQAGGMGGPVVEKPNYALLGAVAEGPDANWYFKLTGPEATIQAQRAAFEAMIRSLKPGA